MKFCLCAQFCHHHRCGKFRFGQRVLETPKTYKFIPKMDSLAGNKELGGRKALQRDRKDVRTWGQENAAPAYFGTNLEVLGVSKTNKQNITKLSI